MTQEACVVCGERLDAVNVAVCGECGGRYHLVMKTDQPGKDCGDVWLNEVYLALQFACFNCLRGGRTGTKSAQALGEGQRPLGQRAETLRRPARLARVRGPRIRRRYRKR